MFKSRVEAYLFAIKHLRELYEKNKNGRRSIKAYLRELQIAVEDHVQDPTLVANLLRGLARDSAVDFSDDEREYLATLAYTIAISPYKNQTQLEKYKNPWGRCVETHLQLPLLFDPTKQMMTSVQEVSARIIKAMEQLTQDNMALFLNNLTQESHLVAFGAFLCPPTVNDVIAILDENRVDNLITILFIHFKFAQAVMRQQTFVNVANNQNEPIGGLKDLLRDFSSDKRNDFFAELTPQKTRYIPDKRFYHSDLYTAYPNRGRAEFIEGRTHQMGLMLPEQQDFCNNIPSHSSHWCADARCQHAELDSPYVRDAIENDGVYISGPSGMTGLILGLMECFANFPTITQKQYYLAALCAYLVGGGLHNLHEVIGPAQYVLKLVPGYRIVVPSDNLAPPPNYHRYYHQQMLIDPDFEKRYTRGWHNLIKICTKLFAKRTLPIDKYWRDYAKLWQKACINTDNATPEQQMLMRARTLLIDYSKNNNRAMLFFTAHWNRHHCATVNKILKNDFSTVAELIEVIEKETAELNPNGDLARRLEFLKSIVCIKDCDRNQSPVHTSLRTAR